jgi:hypothetical protein
MQLKWSATDHSSLTIPKLGRVQSFTIVDKPVTFSEPVLADQFALPLRRRVGAAPWMRRWAGAGARQFPAPREGRSLHRVRGLWVDAELTNAPTPSAELMVIGVLLKADLQGTWFRRADYF